MRLNLAWTDGDRGFIAAEVALDDGCRIWQGGCFRDVSWLQRPRPRHGAGTPSAAPRVERLSPGEVFRRLCLSITVFRRLCLSITDQRIMRALCRRITYLPDESARRLHLPRLPTGCRYPAAENSLRIGVILCSGR